MISGVEASSLIFESARFLVVVVVVPELACNIDERCDVDIGTSSVALK